MKSINKLFCILIGFALLACAFIEPALAVPGGTIMISGTFSPKFTFSDTEVMDFKELIVEDIFEKPAISEFFTIIPEIRSGKKIGIVGEMSAIGRPKGACDTSETDVTIATVEKAWAPCSWGDRLPFCVEDLEDQFIVWGLNNGIKRPDLDGTDYADFINMLVADAMLESLYRTIWFGDVNADEFSEGGVLTNGTDPTLFQCHDGVWKQVFDIVASDPDRKSDTGLTSKNAEATFALQEFDDQDTTDLLVTNALRLVINGSTLKARSRNDRFIVVTQSVADQYSVELEQASGIEAAWVMLQDGRSKIRRMGIDIIAIPKLDDIIRTFFINGGKFNLPHRILMFNKGNIGIGVEDESTLSEFEMFYDKKEKKNFVDFLAKLDTKIFEDIHIQAAF